MGYYAPSFGRLDQGWYFSTTDSNYSIERDRCIAEWNSDCDKLLRDELDYAGMFIMAFERNLKQKIKTQISSNFPFPRYFGYHYMSLILADDSMRNTYIHQYEKNHARSFVCTNCGEIQGWDDIHPSIIGRTKRVIPLCNNCAFWLAEISDLTKVDVIPSGFSEWYKRLFTRQTCPVCNKSHTWLKAGQKHEIGLIDFPGKYIEICKRCASTTIGPSNPSLSIEQSCICLKTISETLGCIPNRDGYLFEQAKDLETAISITKLLTTMHPLRDITAHYGSWFKVLIASGILPQGTRKTHFGTMVLAKDGCQCLSMAEKDIDDKLSFYEIPHEREPHYPGTNYRADWKIKINNKEVFIEFFGLHGEQGYNKRMKEKVTLANQLNIEVIPFLPKDMISLDIAFKEKILSRFASQKAYT